MPYRVSINLCVRACVRVCLSMVLDACVFVVHQLDRLCYCIALSMCKIEEKESTENNKQFFSLPKIYLLSRRDYISVAILYLPDRCNKLYRIQPTNGWRIIHLQHFDIVFHSQSQRFLQIATLIMRNRLLSETTETICREVRCRLLPCKMFIQISCC